eukprot:Rhum_TRINITY_DN18469_c0_g1::Rhum_TRINITY_DN18469_c0_g1_i1::g.167266::m.167266
MGVPVTLHIYDVTNVTVIKYLNKVTKDVGGVGGAFHAAVEVYGWEWSFGCTVSDETGVFKDHPAKCPLHQYRDSIAMGETELSEEEFDVLIKQMELDWRGPSYDLLNRNCCVFSDALCVALGVGHVPSWLNRFGGIGGTARSGGSAAAGEANKAMAKVGIDKHVEKVAGFVKSGIRSGLSALAAQKSKKSTTTYEQGASQPSQRLEAESSDANVSSY